MTKIAICTALMLICVMVYGAHCAMAAPSSDYTIVYYFFDG